LINLFSLCVRTGAELRAVANHALKSMLSVYEREMPNHKGSLWFDFANQAYVDKELFDRAIVLHGSHLV
jgi:hypothetical protein